MSDHRDRIFSEYQSERNSFRRLTIVAVLLGIFFILVYQPYLELLSEIYEGEKAKPEIEKELLKSKRSLRDTIVSYERATEYMGDASAYDALYQDAENWINGLDAVEQAFDRQSRRVRSIHNSLSNDLRSQWTFGTIPNPNIRATLNRSMSAEMKSDSTKNPCFFLIDDDWLNCELNSKRKPMNDRLARVLYDRSSGHVHTQRLKTEIDKNREKFRQQRDERIVAGEMILWFQESLEAERKTIRNWYEEMARLRQDSNKDLQEHEKKLREHNEWLATLDERKKELSLAGKISTPLGPIKLAFHDLLSLLPLFTLGLFSLMLFSQMRQLRLRNLYISESKIDESEYSLIYQIMPVSIDPRQSGIVRKILMFAAFIVPPVIALKSWFTLRSHAAFDLVGLTLDQPSIRVATGLAAIIFVYLFSLLIVQILKNEKTSA